MPADSKSLIEKIEALPAERIAEIEDFVDFIRLREQERAAVKAETARQAAERRRDQESIGPTRPLGNCRSFVEDRHRPTTTSS